MIGTFALVLFFTMLKEAFEVYLFLKFTINRIFKDTSQIETSITKRRLFIIMNLVNLNQKNGMK